MATFLDDLSIYNAKAATVISLTATTGNSGRANLMSSLKSTANDTSLSDEVRLNALTALINIGNLLDIPLPPYFPVTTTFANSQTYTGLHNDLTGLDVEPYLHITTAEKSFFANKANLTDISFANLLGTYTSNAGLTAAINAKQNALNGTGFVKASGGTITYDNSTYLTNISSIAAGGDLAGFYPNPTIKNTSVTGQLLTGFNASAPTGSVTGASSILSAFETLNANINNVIATSGTISSVSFSLPSSVFTFTAGPFTSGAANLSGTFNNQAQNAFFAGPTGGGTGQPTFRAIVAGDLPVSGATASTYGSASSIPVLSVDVYGRVTAIANVTAASGGQVNTITYSVPAGVFTGTAIGSSTVAITLGLSTQTAGTVWAGPVSGGAVTPGFRALTSTDIPNIGISQVSGLSSVLDGYLPDALANGMLFIGNVSDVAVNAIVTGDLTATYVDNSGTNEAEFTIANEAVTYAKIQNVTSQTLLGRFALTNGVAQQLTLNGSDFTINSSTGVIGLVTPNSPILTTKGDILTHTGAAQARLGIGANATFFMADTAATTGNKWVAMSGDATIATSGALTIAAGAVTLAKMANLAANRIIGNNTGSAATPIALTATQVTAMLNQFTTSAQGLVPAASGGLDATYFLNATGAWSVPAGGGGGGSGTVTSVSVVSANGFAGTVATATTTPAITLTTSITGLLKGNGTAISAATAGTDYLTSVGLTMPTAFTVTTSPLTANGTLAVTGAGTVSQYIRGDGTLANFPTSGGGGASLSYYLNGSVASSVAGYEQMNRVPVIGAGTNYTLSGTSGLIAQFITDVNDPSLLNIPAGAWDINAYFSASNNTGSPTFYVELLKYDTATTTFTSIATGSTELIDLGTTIHLYTTSISVPSTPLTVTDRLVIKVFGDTNGGSRTITFHTEGPHLAQIITTFTTGLTAFNGLTAQVQFLGAVGTTGTAPAWTSTTATHTLNIPLASASSVTAGLISKTEYDTFNGKMSNPMTAVGDIIYGGTVTSGVAAPTRLAGQTTNGIYLLRANVTASAAVAPDWLGSTGSGNVVLATSPTLVTPILGAATATSISLGVVGPSGTTGQIILRNSANANLVTIQAGATSTTTVYTLPLADGSSGQVLRTNGSGVLSWISASGTGTVTSVAALTLGTSGTDLTSTVANGTTTPVITLNVPDASATARGVVTTGTQTFGGAKTFTSPIFLTSITTPLIIGGTATTSTLTYRTTSGTGAAGADHIFQVGTNGATEAMRILNSGAIGIGLTTPVGRLHLAAGTSTVPQLALNPSSAATFIAGVNGYMYYDTVSSNSSLSLYKDSAYTKLVTIARNPDFAVAATNGVIISDASGNLTKSGDLTALGIFATTSTVTTTVASATSVIGTIGTGSVTLPASFFGVGKTIIITAIGKMTSSITPTTIAFVFTLGGATYTFTSPTLTASLTDKFYRLVITGTCRTTGASGTIFCSGELFVDGISGSVYVPPATATINTTGTLAIGITSQWGSTGQSITTDIVTGVYLN